MKATVEESRRVTFGQRAELGHFIGKLAYDFVPKASPQQDICSLGAARADTGTEEYESTIVLHMLP